MPSVHNYQPPAPRPAAPTPTIGDRPLIDRIDERLLMLRSCLERILMLRSCLDRMPAPPQTVES